MGLGDSCYHRQIGYIENLHFLEDVMKRYLSLSFALLALFLAACNGPLPSTDSTPASSVASASTPSPSESTDAEEQPADAPQETLPADLDWQPYEVSTFASLSQTEGLTDVSEFSPAGEIRPLLDLATVDGYSTAEGFYRFVPREDASSNLCYIDFASGQEIYLCSQPNCAHADASCTSWYPSNLGILLPIPVGDRLVVLHGGSPSYASLIGDDALAQIEFAALDGSGRSTGIVFPSNVQITSLPRGGYAYDDENVYFIATTTMESSTLRTLCAANAVTGQVFALCDLPNEEEKILGGVGSKLIVSYSPGAYDMSISATDLQTEIACIDLSAHTMAPLFSYPYLSVGGIQGTSYIVLTPDSKLLTYDLQTGQLVSELAVTLPEGFDPQNMHGDGLFGGKILAHSFQISSSDAPSQLFYCAVDTESGDAHLLNAVYEANGAYSPGTIAAETEDQLLFAYGQETLLVTLPDGSQISYPHYQYALTQKDDFWNNTGNYAIVAHP